MPPARDLFSNQLYLLESSLLASSLPHTRDSFLCMSKPSFFFDSVAQSYMQAVTSLDIIRETVFFGGDFAGHSWEKSYSYKKASAELVKHSTMDVHIMVKLHRFHVRMLEVRSTITSAFHCAQGEEKGNKRTRIECLFC